MVDERGLVAQVELNIIYHLLMMPTTHNTCKTGTCLLFYDLPGHGHEYIAMGIDIVPIDLIESMLILTL